MNNLSRSILFTCLLLTVLTIIPGTGVADDHVKSLALKDHSPQHVPFHLTSDRSANELWNNFMLMKQANSGDALAQHELGLRYLTGKGFSADTSLAAHWIGKAADQNLLAARYNFGILLNNGWGVPWNPFDAYKHFQYAARHGMMEAQYVYGLLLTDNLVAPRNYSEAYRWVKASADSGYDPAKDVLTEFKKMGITARIRSQHENAGTRGNNQARSNPRSHTQSTVRPLYLDLTPDSVPPKPDDQTLLKEALSDGSNQPKDVSDEENSNSMKDVVDSVLVRSLYAAAGAGSPEALTLLGRSYEEGAGVDTDSIEAAVHYLHAIRFDSYWSSVLLSQLIRAPGFFHRLKERVDRNDPAAEFVWAGLIAFGFDNQLVESQALELLKHAADQRFTEAVVELGICYYTGKWVKENREQGIQLFRKAEQMGSREANIRLCMIELMNNDQQTPDSTLLKTLIKSADDGSILAQSMLGYCYQEGKGVSVNLPQAVRFYRKALQRGSKIAYEALRKMYDEFRPDDAEFQLQE